MPSNQKIVLSPTPWYISSQSKTGKYTTIKDANGRTVARVSFYSEKTRRALSQGLGTPFDPIEAKRIVACVNACEGLNPEAVPGLIKHLGVVYCHICGKLAKQPQGNHCAACNSRRVALANAKSRKG